MKDEEVEGLSPPRRPPLAPQRHHPSPLPISTGLDNENYSFSPSTSVTPQVSPRGSFSTSDEKRDLMHGYEFFDTRSLSAPSSFSMDRIRDEQYCQSTSRLKEL